MTESALPIAHRCIRAAHCADRERIETKPGQQCPCTCHGMGSAWAVCDIDGGCGHLHAAPQRPETTFVGARIEQARGLCERCSTQTAQAIAALPMDYTELNLLLGRDGSGIVDIVVRSTRDLPVPIRLSVAALQTSIVRTAELWARAVADQLSIDWDVRSMAMCRPGAVLQRASLLLGNGFGTLVNLPVMPHRHHASGQWTESDGLDGALELLHLHSLVRFAAGRTKLIHRLPAPCPRCERMTLVRHNGDDHVECTRCRHRWPEEQYHRLCLVLAEDYRDIA